MDQQHPLGTGNSISAREAEQIKKLITDLTSTVEVLDADIAAKEKRPNVDCRSRDNRRNIMVTIGTLQDRLFSIEHTVREHPMNRQRPLIGLPTWRF